LKKTAAKPLKGPSKSRRGRPPKVKVEAVKKPRGRPPKVKVELQEVKAVKKPRGRPPKVKVKAVKKPRGRPPKVKVEAVKKPRGRPPKVKVENTSEPKVLGEVTKPKEEQALEKIKNHALYSGAVWIQSHLHPSEEAYLKRRANKQHISVTHSILDHMVGYFSICDTSLIDALK
jgi:ubiquitin